MRRAYRRLLDAWFGAQVELHGQYSLARLQSLHAYTQNTPMWRVVLVCLATPVFAILLITATDAMRLEAPSRGLSESLTLWIRAFISVCAISGGAIIQLRIVIPNLAMSVIEVVVLTLVSSAVAVATQYGLAVAIGYPVPFGLVLGTPSCLVVIVAGVTIPRWTLLQAKPRLRRQLGDYVNVLMCQVGMTVVYPVYNFAFSRLRSTAQTAFVLLLPVIKLVNKNWLTHSLRDTDDMRPELVTFNVEVFHALYVSMCMQSSTSINTTVAIMAIDLLQAWIAIRDVHHIVQDVEKLLAKVPLVGRRVSAELASTANQVDGTSGVVPASASCRERTLIESAIAILVEDTNVRNHNSMRQGCLMSCDARRASATVTTEGPSLGLRVSSIPSAATADRGTRNHRPSKPKRPTSLHPDTSFGTTICESGEDPLQAPARFVYQLLHPQRSSTCVVPTMSRPSRAMRAHTGLDGDERLFLVQSTLRVLFVTEFVVLVEYAEVMIPIIYSTCVVGMVRMPNRAYYGLLATMSDEQLSRTFRNVSLYGALELVSFVAFCLLLRRRLRLSVLTQVAFVLENQFVMVQAKLTMWVFYVIQTSLQHFGADYSFSFQWLKAAH